MEAQFCQDHTQTEHRVRKLSTHRAADTDFCRWLGATLTTVAIKRSTTGSAVQSKPATVSYVRSTTSVYGIESFVQIEKKFTSFKR